ncbi:MAG: ATP-binding protein [Planctomycetota bacterium]|nr:ATP-binding protein [Planctomycetota bacterium]
MSTALRDRAEQMLDQTSQSLDVVAAADVRAMIHELRVHQIELELQNKELQASQMTLQESRDRFADLYDLAPVSYLTLVGDNFVTVQQANRAAAELFDRTRAELVGTQWTRLIHRDDQDAWYLFRFNLLAGSPPCSCELRIGELPDQKTVQLEAVAIRDGSGGVRSLLVTLTDVTDRRASEQRLRQQSDDLKRSRLNLLSLLEDQRAVQTRLEKSEERLRHLLLKLPAAAYTCDTEGLITLFNERAVELWGRGPALNDPVDRYCGAFKLFSPDGTPIEHRNCWTARALQDDAEFNGQSIIVERPDGTRRVALAHASPLHDDQGNLSGAINVLVDVTPLREAESWCEAAYMELSNRMKREKEIVEAELSKVREELVRSTRLATLGTVAAQMAHELRNPLGAVRNAAYYVRGELPKAQPELLSMLQVIDDELATADIIIRGLLNATQSPEPNPRLMDVTVPIMKSFERLHAKQGVSLRLDSPSQPLQIYFDPLQLRQLLDNLLSNAHDAVGESGEIRVALRSTEDCHEIRVTDSGPGIPENLRTTVFDQFFTTKPQGIGLGLGICQQVVQRHGGRIRVEEDNESGTTIVVEIPRPPNSIPNGEQC